MKILLVQDYLRSGGTERQSILLANAFAEAGHLVTLLTFRPGGPLISTISAQVTHCALQAFDTRLDWFAPGLSAYARKASPDVILCMGRMANCWGSSLLKCAPVVIGSMRTGKNLPWLYRRFLRSAQQVIANSHAARDTLVKTYKLNAAKIAVIHNSLVFPEPAGADPAILRSQMGAGPDTTVLLDVAMFRPEKNQRELIAIVADLPAQLDWQLWLLGDGPELGRCQQVAQKLKVADRVKFPGLIRKPAAYYDAANIAVHASRSESLSNFLIESQAHGLPVVAYNAQGIEESFIPNVTGIALPFGDQAGFRAGIQRFASPDPVRKEKSRRYARETFDPARQVQAYLDLFTHLVKP